MLATEHLNAYNYDYNKPISDFQNHITDPYNEYSTPPNNLFRIGERDPFNNIQAEVYKTPVNVVDDSIIKVDYDMRKLVKDGYFTVKKRQAERQVEVCETVQEDVYNDDGEVIDTKPVKECHNETKSYTKKETGEFSGDDSSWNYSNWVKPVYEKVTKHQCIHNTQEENFCETYNCDQTYPEKDDDGYIVDENLPENQNSSFYWDVGDWSGCDGQCGVGTETRSVTCVSTLGGSSSQCTEPKPISERPCQGADANCSFEWKTSDWSNCSEVCDGGFKTRDVYCKAPSGNTVSNKRCDPQNKPNGQTICNTGTCGYSFEKTEWSSCISNARCQPPERTEVCYQIRGKTGAVIGKECYPVVNNPSTARSTGWLNNQTTTLEGYRDTGFNGSHFSCGFSNTSKCWKRHPGKSGERVEGRRTSSVTYGQERRSVKCIRKMTTLVYIWAFVELINH